MFAGWSRKARRGSTALCWWQRRDVRGTICKTSSVYLLLPFFEWIRKLSEHYLLMSNLCSLTLYDILHKLGSSCTSIHLFHIFLPLQFKLLSLIYQAWGFLFKLLSNLLYWELILLWSDIIMWFVRYKRTLPPPHHLQSRWWGTHPLGKQPVQDTTRHYKNSHSAGALYFRTNTVHFLFHFNTALNLMYV